MTARHGRPAAETAVPETETAAAVANVTGLYRAHVRPLYGFIYSKVGNRAAAEDITSDVFLQALTHLDPLRVEHSCVAWLYRVARNAVHDYWRGGRDGSVIALDGVQPGPLPHPTPESALRAQRERTAATARATAILARLPGNYRTVLALRILEGLSVAETAQRMGISTGNATSCSTAPSKPRPGMTTGMTRDEG